MKQFSITFGQKYRSEPHPVSKLCHPDGWVVVHASSYEDARFLVSEAFENKWGFIYDGPEPSSPWLYGLGQTGTLVRADGKATLVEGVLGLETS